MKYYISLLAEWLGRMTMWLIFFVVAFRYIQVNLPELPDISQITEVYSQLSTLSDDYLEFDQAAAGATKDQPVDLSAATESALTFEELAKSGLNLPGSRSSDEIQAESQGYWQNFPEYSGTITPEIITQKIDADITDIVQTVQIYSLQTGQTPPGLSQQLQQIGTAEGNLDLESLLVPEYVPDWYYHPEGGTKENTGYWIKLQNENEVIVQSGPNQ